MLILTRGVDEKVIITLPDGRRVSVTLVSIHGDRVRLGFDAPRDIPIHREEVQAEIDREAGR